MSAIHSKRMTPSGVMRLLTTHHTFNQLTLEELEALRNIDDEVAIQLENLSAISALCGESMESEPDPIHFESAFYLIQQYSHMLNTMLGLQAMARGKLEEIEQTSSAKGEAV